MSFNHSKSDRNDPAAYRKTGRSTSFNQQRSSSGAHGRGGGGGGGGYAPASTSASSLSSSRSFNKKSNNAQVGQPRVNPSPVNSTESNYASAARVTSNGTHVQPQVHGASDGPVTKSSESSAAQRSSRVVSKAPTSQKSSMSSDTAAPPSPAKGGDASNVFSFQFGSISAGVTNGMAIPARTNSAPPNLDEQKRDQARHESYRSAVSAPVPPVPRQQQPSRKDAGVTEQSNAGEPYMGTKFKQDPQVSALTPLNQMQKLSVPASGISMVALPYHQSQASLQFGGPNPQIPSQSLSTASLQMPIPMPLPIGNAAQVQPQVFVQGLQPHPMHPQGIMHQSQNMSYIPHPLSHQLGNMGIGMGHQYSQPQGGKFTGPRKPTPVKITHPDTHQELKLEKREDAYSDGGSSGARSHPNVPSQSQPVKSFSASHPINYYSPSSYNPSSLYYPPSSSLPMTNSLITTNSQPPIFNSPVSHAPQNVGFMNSPSLSSVSVSKANTPIPGIVEPTNVEFSRDVPNMSGVASVTIKSSVVSSVVDSSSANSSVSDVQNSEPPGSSLNCDAGSTVPQKECEILDTSPQQSKYSSDSSVSCSLPKQSVASVAVTTDKLTVTPFVLHTSDLSEDSISVVSNHEQKRESLSRSNSLKDNQKKPGKKGQSSQHQVSVQSPAVDSVPSQAVDSGISDTGVSESVGTKTNDYVGIPSEDSPISETLSGSISGAIETKTNGSGEASACVSSEGSDSGALASGSLNNHMHDKIDESSEDLQCADLPEKTLMDVNDGSENSGGDSMSLSVSGSKDTTNLEANRGKTTTKGKKKRREILQKADAAGSTSDLYNAYKGPEEKKEAVLISQSTEGASISENLKQFPAEAALSDAKASEKNNHIKAEPDDWEDAADMSTPKLKVDEESPPVNDGTAKKYSRDFLLKFAEQCPDLPEGFEITADIAEALVSANRNSFHVIERDSHPTTKGKKKRREILQKADAAGSTSSSLPMTNSLITTNKGKKGQSSQHQVSVQSPAVDGVPSQAVDSGISDTGVSESVGTKTNDSLGIPSEDPAISDTLSGSISGVIEAKTNGSGEASACVSGEGSGALASDSLNNHKQDKIDESSEDLQCADLPENSSKDVNDSSDNSGGDSMSLSVSGTKDRPNLEPNRVKATAKGKKKRREILQKADAAGSTSDLYNAYKGPEEKKETVLISQSTEGASISENLKHPEEATQSDAKSSEKHSHIKAEPDDWEDAADMSTPKLKVDEKSQVSDGTAKKYSRDFLLKFAEQCTDLPEGFEITADIAEALVSANRNSFHVIERDSHPSPGRIVDRSGGMSRTERRGNVVNEDDRWSKVSNAFHSGRGLDGSGGNAGFRSGQGGGVLRNPRAQGSMQYAGGVLSGPMHSAGNQGGMQRNSPDGERWQRAPSFQQRGLIPSPTSQTPLQMMHKAEKKYEVGKVSDTEEVKQRQLKGILNKLTPQNFDRLFEQVKAVNIDNAITLTGVISQIFEKALMEPTFCEMYANFCSHLASELPDFSENNEKITFKRLLLNKCQEEFERGEREQEEANKVEEDGIKQSDEEREAKRVKARRRMLGNIRLIGELYKKRMLTERIMHECIKKLLGQYQDPDEEDVEALCKLMSTIGEMIDHPKAKEHMDAYFERMKIFSNNMNLSSRVRFMLKDAIDLRRNKWQQRRKVEGPKKIEEVHRDAAQERHAQAGRLGRGVGNIQSVRRNPMDYSPRGSSMMSSPNAQMGGLRGLPTQARGYGSQDARFEERQSYEARTLSVASQRPLGDDSLFVPQGGLGKVMSSRGSPAISNLPTSDVHSGSGYSHRTSTGLNGPNNLSERTAYSPRVDLASRDGRNADRNLDRPVPTSPPAQLQGTLVSQNASSDSEAFPERLQGLSLSAIREYYSARDVNEVALCVKDLNSPSFHPSMVSLWVIDSFERKDTERDLLAKLLVNLVKSQNGTLNQAQLVKGFESALRTLEDAVNDAPKAPEFLGRIFAKVITESVVSLNEIGQLIHDGGEEPESLLQVGLAADVLGSTLEAIRLEKGDAVLSEIRTSSNLQLETFRPPKPITSRKLEAFI